MNERLMTSATRFAVVASAVTAACSVVLSRTDIGAGLPSALVQFLASVLLLLPYALFAVCFAIQVGGGGAPILPWASRRSGDGLMVVFFLLLIALVYASDLVKLAYPSMEFVRGWSRAGMAIFVGLLFTRFVTLNRTDRTTAHSSPPTISR